MMTVHSILSPRWMAISVSLIAMLGIGFVPLFGGPGYENALAAGILLPSICAVASAIGVSREDLDQPIFAISHGMLTSITMIGVAILSNLFHGVRVGFCDAQSSWTLFALGPAMGVIFAGVWGSCIGWISILQHWKRVSIVLGSLFLPWFCISVSGYRFYASPMVFAYDPFVGFFSGTLYDTIIDSSGLISYRFWTSLLLLGMFLLITSLHCDNGYVRIRRGSNAAIGIMFLSGAMYGHWKGSSFDFFHTAESIAKELGGRKEGKRCVAVYARTIKSVEVDRLLRDCDALIDSGEAWWGASGSDKITMYLFENAQQKRRLMGAADTYIAKPWRNEIYLQNAGYPHPAMGHEIMHVIAGSSGRGPFRIAGSWGGLWPSPGLIEGVAVAGAPRESDLSNAEWAKAMKDLGLLPPLKNLFALGFLGENSSTAYTASGAFVEYYYDRFGSEALRRWYAGESVEKITQLSWSDLEAQWHVSIDNLKLSTQAMEQARARFEKPSVFRRKCPHWVDQCKDKAEQWRNRGDEAGAVEWYERAHNIDERDVGTQLGLARSLFRLGNRVEAEKLLQNIVTDMRYAGSHRARAFEELGDEALLLSQAEKASLNYQQALLLVFDGDQRRTLELKINATIDDRGREAIVEYLLGNTTRGPDKVRALLLLSRWAQEDPDNGLPHYLIGKSWFAAGNFEDAKEQFRMALSKKLSIERIRIEANRSMVIIGCGLYDEKFTRSYYDEYAAGVIPNARKQIVGSLMNRCFHK